MKILINIRNLFVSIITIILVLLVSSSYTSAVNDPNLSIIISTSKALVDKDERFAVTITVKNNDSRTIDSLGVVVDTVNNSPDYITCDLQAANAVQNGCSGVTWNVSTPNNFAPGATFSRSYNFLITSDAPQGVSQQLISYGVAKIGSTNYHISGNSLTIKLKTVTATPTPSPSGVPTATSTPKPTATRAPVATSTPKPSTTVTTTVTPVPTNTVSYMNLPSVFTKPSAQTSVLNTNDNLKEFTGFVLDNPEVNKISFQSAVDISDTTKLASLDSYVMLDKVGEVSINSEDFPGLNKPSLITMRNINFIEPKVLRNGASSEGYVSDVVYDRDNKILEFKVTGFSTYTVVEGRQNQVNESVRKSRKSINPIVITSITALSVILAGAAFIVIKFKGRP